jgi:hypothetical protein
LSDSKKKSAQKPTFFFVQSAQFSSPFFYILTKIQNLNFPLSKSFCHPKSFKIVLLQADSAQKNRPHGRFFHKIRQAIGLIAVRNARQFDCITSKIR